MRRVFLVLLWTFFVAAAPPPARNRIAVAMSIGNPPYEYVDAGGRASGFNADLLRALGPVMGMEIDIRPMSFGEARDAFDRGEVDAQATVVFSEDRAKVMDFAVPSHTISYILLTRKGSAAIHSEQELTGKTVLVNRRNIVGDYLRQRGHMILETGSNEESAHALATGRGDCAVVPRLVWRYLQQTRPMPGLEEMHWELLHSMRGIVVHKGDSALLARFNAGLFELQRNGTLDQLREKHFAALEAADIPKQIMLLRAFKATYPWLALTTLLLLALWAWSMRRSTRARTRELETQLEALTVQEAEGQAQLARETRGRMELELLMTRLSRSIEPHLESIELEYQVMDRSHQAIARSLEQAPLQPVQRRELSTALQEALPGARDRMHLAILRIRMAIDGTIRMLHPTRRQPTLQVVDMEQVVQEARSHLASLIQATGATLTVDPLPPCQGDPRVLCDVWTNLLDNALRHGVPPTPPRIHLSGRREGDRVVYAIQDRGPGMDPALMGSVWDLLRQVSRQTRGGLGLPLSRRLVEHLGGRIWVDPTSSHGCRVCLELAPPATASEAAPPSPPEA